MRRRFVAIALLALPIGIAISIPVARVSSMHLRNADTNEVTTTPAPSAYDGAQLVFVGTLLVALAGVVRRSFEPQGGTEAGRQARQSKPVSRSTASDAVL